MTAVENVFDSNRGWQEEIYITRAAANPKCKKSITYTLKKNYGISTFPPLLQFKAGKKKKNRKTIFRHGVERDIH